MATKSKPKTEPKRLSKKAEDAAWSMQRRWNCLQMAKDMGFGTDYLKVGAAADYFTRFVETGLLGRRSPLHVVEQQAMQQQQ